MHQVNPEVMTSGQEILKGNAMRAVVTNRGLIPGTTLPLPKPHRPTPDQFTQLPSGRKIIAIMNLPNEAR